MANNGFSLVVGMEIHVELATNSKMFCGCPADWFGKEPNTQTCPVCLGMPGAIPVPNKKAIQDCILIGKALNCKTHTISKFDRKNYFYPDLAKSYQISQYDLPFSYEGHYDMMSKATGQMKRIGITRVHMEEDTGKLTHEGSETLVDFNRCGVPLVEIVTEPDFDNSEDVKQFLEELHTIIRYVGISDADMEKGSMRLEPNISLKKPGETELPKYKVEVKNINSFRFAKLAIEYEISRQQLLLEKNEIPAQETRGYDEKKGVTVSQRAKEDAAEYRYFPDPDIPPFELSDEFIAEITARLPELPHEKVARFVKDFGTKEADAFVLTRNVETANYYEKLASKKPELGAKIASLMVNKKISETDSIEKNLAIIETLSKPQDTDDAALREAVTKVISGNADAVAQYKAGKESIIMFLVGQVMREMKGKADAQLVKASLERSLK